jgi:hypothetical protein
MLPSAGLGAAASSSAEWAERTSGAAAALATAAAFWSVLHPPSYEVLRALAAAIPVAAGFAETARSCALGRLAPGAQVGARARASSAVPEAGCRHLDPWAMHIVAQRWRAKEHHLVYRSTDVLLTLWAAAQMRLVAQCMPGTGEQHTSCAASRRRERRRRRRPPGACGTSGRRSA